MKNDTSINKVKQNNYKVLYGKLNDALKQKFYFEAILIEYSIIEDRISSIIFHSDLNKNIYESKLMLGIKLNLLESQIDKKNDVVSKCIDKKLIGEIKKWKDERNVLVHKACTSYDSEKTYECAKNGKELGRKLDSCASKVKKKMSKKNK